MSRGQPWHCPTCLRSVPARVETCYCGTSREQAERAAHAAQPEASGGRLPWIPLGLVALALGVLVFSLRRDNPEPAAPPPPPPSTAATPRPPPPLRGSPPRVGVTVPRRPTPVPPAPLPPAAAPEPEPAREETTPAPEEEEDDDDGLADQREAARAAFEARLAALASRRDALTDRLRAWDASCGTGSSAVRPAGCVLLQEDIEGLVDEVDGGLREGEREARRGWVQPGVRRSLLESYELDARTWAALRRRATEALR